MFIFDLYVGDEAISTPKTVFTVNKTRLKDCFHNPSDLDHCFRVLIS